MAAVKYATFAKALGGNPSFLPIGGHNGQEKQPRLNLENCIYACNQYQRLHHNKMHANMKIFGWLSYADTFLSTEYAVSAEIEPTNAVAAEASSSIEGVSLSFLLPTRVAYHSVFFVNVSLCT